MAECGNTPFGDMSYSKVKVRIQATEDMTELRRIGGGGGITCIGIG